MFTETKNKNILKSLENPTKEMILFSRDQELKALSENKLYQGFTDSQRRKVEDLLFKIYNPEIMEEKVARFDSITREMVDTYERKNHDYGDSFGDSIKKYGPIAGLVRLSDKWNRLNSLILAGDQKVKDESIVDTLTDLACYAIMLRMELTQE